MRKRRTGRPRKSPGEKRARGKRVWFTIDEDQLVSWAAADAGYDFSVWARPFLLAAARRARRKHERRLAAEIKGES